MTRILDITAEVIEVPLKHAFATAKDNLARMVSRAVVITVQLDDGRSAVGEAVPVEYVTGETPETVLVSVRQAAPVLTGLDVSRLRPLLNQLADALPNAHTARAGLEVSLYNAHAAVNGVMLWSHFGGAIDSVETDVTLSIAPDATDRAIDAAKLGFRRFKMKVGGSDRKADLDRVIQVHRAIPDAIIRLDANQGFDVEGAMWFIGQVLSAGVRLELVEQPVPKDDLAALDEVARRSPTPIIADEAVITPVDALRVVSETCAHGINVKLMKSGISGALDIIAIARAARRKLMIGCMLETRRGIAASLALACGTGAFDYIDLDSHMLLDEPGPNPWFKQDGPVLSVGP